MSIILFRREKILLADEPKGFQRRGLGQAGIPTAPPLREILRRDQP